MYFQVSKEKFLRKVSESFNSFLAKTVEVKKYT